MSNHIRLRAALLRITVILSCWLQTYHSVTAADVVVQDTDPSILYQPQSSWFTSSQSCSACLNPGGSTSYHEAINPAADLDDLPKSSSPGLPSSTSPSSRPVSSSPPAPSPNLVAAASSSSITLKKATTASPSSSATSTAKPDDPEDPDRGSHGSGSNSGSSGSSGSTPGGSGSTPGGSGSTPGGSGKQRRNIISRTDADDVDITLTFNFTGSAIYLYGIQPQGVATAKITDTPANMNLTFTLDGEPAGTFNHHGSDGSPGYVLNAAVFSRNALEESPHQLVVHVGQNSSFLFDYLVYSTNATTNSTSTSTTPLAQSTPSPSVDPNVKKHNVATFAGAVGGSVGVLALFSLGLALSIIRRRRLAAARDRLDSESLHTNGSDDSPHMSGPAPFVPRFFPDTVIPSEPPTYMVALATNTNNSTLLSSLTSSPYSATTRSYADIPPSTPPPLEDVPLMPPPPPFPGTVSIRPLNLPAGALAPSLPGASQISHILDPVGTDYSNSATTPELVPLLPQPAESDPRPPSRASSRSYDINGNPVDDDDEL